MRTHALVGCFKIASEQGQHPAEREGIGVCHRARSRQSPLNIVCTTMRPVEGRMIRSFFIPAWCKKSRLQLSRVHAPVAYL
jgi:hypothetical protein